MDNLNLYGDSSLDELNGYGVDISMQRTDGLDIEMLNTIDLIKKTNLRVIDLGCGKGGQSIRLAYRNCQVTAIDIQNFSKEIYENCKNDSLLKSNIKFIKSDIRHTSEYLIGDYDFMYSQRTLHYIDYLDAEKLLKNLKQHFIKSFEAKLFISVSGIDSELGENYEDRHKPIKYRFCQLDKKMRFRHKMLLPVCLYSLNEFETLLNKSKYKIEKIYQSEFGNIKAIAKPF